MEPNYSLTIRQCPKTTNALTYLVSWLLCGRAAITLVNNFPVFFLVSLFWISFIYRLTDLLGFGIFFKSSVMLFFQ